MATKKPESQLHTSATPEKTADDEFAAGMGGSYIFDPKTGKRELAHRSDASAGGVSNKKPLTDEHGKPVDIAAPADAAAPAAGQA